MDNTQGSLTIHKTTADKSLSIDEAIIVLQTFKELDQAAKQLWETLDNAVLKPRTDIHRPKIYTMKIESVRSASLIPLDYLTIVRTPLHWKKHIPIQISVHSFKISKL